MIAFESLPQDMSLAVIVFVAAFVALLCFKAFAVRQLRRLVLAGRLEYLGDVEQIVHVTRLPFLLGIALLAGLSQLELSAGIGKWLQSAWVVILVTQIAMWGSRVIALSVQRVYERQHGVNPGSATHLMLLSLVGRIVLWSLAALVMLDNLGFNITTLMASLGIGGIAVALAVQNILGDVFSAVSIAFDKPFVIGDFIVVDAYMGTVEYVGMKTTRLRSLGGEQIIFSNTELLKNRIRNFKRMQERRVLLEFGIAAETSIDSIERIPLLVKEIISKAPYETRFDRAHFTGHGASALMFEAVYYVLDPDYNKHMDIQQAINLALLRQFRQHDITFAYPTTTLHIAPGTNSDTPQRASDVITH